MKLAYGTYAMPDTPLADAFATIAEVGFEGVEICIGPRHTMPEALDAAARRELAAQLRDLGLTVPAFMILGSIHGDDAAHAANLEQARQVVQLARDLGVREPPVLAKGFGGKTADWNEVRGPLAARLAEWGKLADELDLKVAGEAHCGAAVDRSARAAAILDEVGHPRVGLHFDIVHFYLAGEVIEDSVAAMLPYTVHTHVTDCRRHADGKFELLLPGDGELDNTAYVAAMHAGGWDDFITLEISTRVWSQPDFESRAAAARCYEVLDRACRAAEVPR